MDPSPEQIATFGKEARRLRRAARLTAVEVAAQLTKRVGRTIPHQSVTAWERGEYGPQDAATAEAYDEIVGAGGALAATLTDSPRLYEEVKFLRGEVAALRDLIERLDRSIGGAREADGAR